MIEESGSHCVIASILQSPFSRRTIDEKTNILEKARPMPNLVTNLSTKNTNIIRPFNVLNYEKHEWLSGCSELNKLFCWPCLLFSLPKESSAGSKTGFSDLNHLSASISRPEKCKTFGKVRVDYLLDHQKKITISNHNETVKRNRHILERLIDAICFLGTQELAFRGYDESLSSVNRGNYIELLEYVFSKIFAFSDVLQNKSLDIGYCIIKINERKEELRKFKLQFSKFFDETKDLMGPLAQKRRMVNRNDPEEPFRQLFNEIFDTILMQFEVRFQSMNDLIFVKLLNCDKFNEYSAKFPIDCINSLQGSYGSLFDFVTLNNELTVIYSSASFKGLSISDLLKKIKSDGLSSTLLEAS